MLLDLSRNNYFTNSELKFRSQVQNTLTSPFLIATVHCKH